MKLNDLLITDYVKLGNSKLPDDTAIFNIAAATDCVNRGTDRCQVDSEECYAYNTEQRWDNTLLYRRRQGRFWQNTGFGEFIEQFKAWKKIKRKPVSRLRFNVSGDIRNREDAEKIERIARSLDIPAYLYTASSHVDLTGVDTAIVQCSNGKLWDKYGHKSNFGRFQAVESFETTDESGVHCPGKCKATEENPDKCTACIKAKEIIAEIH